MPLRVYTAKNGFLVSGKRFSKAPATTKQPSNTATIIKTINRNRTFANLFAK